MILEKDISLHSQAIRISDREFGFPRQIHHDYNTITRTVKCSMLKSTSCHLGKRRCPLAEFPKSLLVDL